MRTMNALVLCEPGRMELQVVPVPDLAPGSVLVKVMAATTCGTDLKAFQRGHPMIPTPGVLGHEYSGIVSASLDERFQPGDEVMGVHSAPCGECRWCLRGQENICESIMETKALGSFAEYLLVPARIASRHLFKKPTGLSFAEASLLEPLACVVQGLMATPAAPEDEVAIIGPGAIGLMFVAALKASGVEKVVLYGRNRGRLLVGEKMGAIPMLLEDAGGAFDLVIEATGKPEVWERSVDLARRGGTVNLFGGCPSGSRVSFDTSRLHYDQIKLVSPFHFGTAAVNKAFTWLTSEGFNLKPLLSGSRALNEAEQVFADLQASRGLKYAFTPHGNLL